MKKELTDNDIRYLIDLLENREERLKVRYKDLVANKHSSIEDIDGNTQEFELVKSILSKLRG